MAVKQKPTTDTAPRDGTMIRFWCRSEAEPVIGYWSKTFIRWVAAVPLIRPTHGHTAIMRNCRKIVSTELAQEPAPIVRA